MLVCLYIVQYYIFIFIIFASAMAAFFHKETIFQQKFHPDINAFKSIHTPSPGRGTAHLERCGQLLPK